MNIVQVNQHPNSQTFKEAPPAETDVNLLNAFKGQLQFAQNDLELMSSHVAKGDELREHHDEIDKKRKTEDLENTIALSYWNDQKLENSFEKSLESKSQGVDAQNLADREKESSRHHAVDNAAGTKKLNQEIGKDRILQLKPYVISSAPQTEGPEVQKPDFAELLHSKQNTPDQNQSQALNKATLANFPLGGENLSQLPNQGQQTRMERDTTQLKPGLEKNEGLKATAAPANNQKPSSSSDYRLNKNETLTTGKEGKNSPLKNEGFINELNASTKTSEKVETSPIPKQSQVEEKEQPNIKNVANNVKIILSAGRDSIVMRLAPEHLGKLEIRLKKAGDALTGEFKVENAEAKNLLLKEFSQLQQDLEAQGIKLENYSIYIKGEENTAFAHKATQSRQQQESVSEHRTIKRSASHQDTKSMQSPVRQQMKSDSGVSIVI